MRILVVNGSPKGEYSITLQTVRYIEKKHPEHEWHVLDAGKRISLLERDFSQAEALFRETDLILFSYPVYTFIAPSQLHRLIRLLKEKQVSLAGKSAAQITTSKHFYDVTAHAYIADNCGDLGLRYLGGLSADMEDLLGENGQRQALDFFDLLMFRYQNDLYDERPSVPVACTHCPVHPAQDVPKKDGDVVIVADLAKEDTALEAMIARFQAVLNRKSRVINIHDFPFRGGCLSCFHCSGKGECIYKDGFQELLRGEIQTADAIVLAFSIQDHSMGTVFKTYDDRQFCNGHRTVTMGKPFGYLVSGDLSREENLRMIIRGRAEVGGNYLAGIACDEKDPDGEIDRMAQLLGWALDRHYVQASNFLGVGGMKIFRDLIWQTQGLMRADHRFFKKHGQYDFPQKRRGRMMLMYLVGAMMSSEKLQKKMGAKMAEGMVAPYKKVLEKET